MRRFVLILNYALIATLFLFLAAAVNAQERVDDSQWPQFTIIGAADCEPVRWFNENPTLAKARTKMHFQVLEPGSKLYQERYASIIAGTPPLILLQRPDGGLIYAAAGGAIPANAEGLVQELSRAWQLAKEAKNQPVSVDELMAQYSDAEDCDGGRCPDRPNTRPLLNPETSPLFIPEKVTAKTGLLSNAIWILVGLVAVIVLGFLFLCGGSMLMGVLYFLYKFIRGIR